MTRPRPEEPRQRSVDEVKRELGQVLADVRQSVNERKAIAAKNGKAAS